MGEHVDQTTMGGDTTCSKNSPNLGYTSTSMKEDSLNDESIFSTSLYIQYQAKNCTNFESGNSLTKNSNLDLK